MEADGVEGEAVVPVAPMQAHDPGTGPTDEPTRTTAVARPPGNRTSSTRNPEGGTDASGE